MTNQLPPSIAVLREHLLEYGFGAHAEPLARLARSSIRLRPRAQDEATVAIGASKLGGRADLPSEFDWPVFRRRPLAFLAQIDLAEVGDLDRERVLPRHGLLSFFYDADEQRAWGSDPRDRGAWAVRHTPGDAELIRSNHPPGVPPWAQFATMRLDPDQEWTLPGWQSAQLSALALPEELLDRYGELPLDEAGAVHRLLGHPQPIQGDMPGEYELASRRVSPVGGAAARDDVSETAAAGVAASSWRLLLQLDSQTEVGMMWGDVGRLYFWIRDDALAARSWSEAWMILQCC
jgi:uncharacterized protein YwqG